MSLDVLELDERARCVTLRYSADGSAGVFAGDVRLPLEDERGMGKRLFEHVAKEMMRQLGRVGGTFKSNRLEIESGLIEFLSGFRSALDAAEPEPMELALAHTAGIDFFSKQASLWGKEMPVRLEILLRRARSHFEFGLPEECRRELAKLALLDPGNEEAARLRERLGVRPPARGVRRRGQGNEGDCDVSVKRRPRGKRG